MSEPVGRAPRRCASPARRLAAALTGGVLLAPAALATPVHAAPATTAVPQPAASGDLRLNVQLTDIRVGGRDAGSVVTWTGTVQNASSAPVYGVRVQPWRSTDQLSAVEHVTDALTTSEPPTGDVTDTPAAQVTAPTAALAPGASGTFAVSATLAQLDMTEAATYWVGVNATGAAAPNGTEGAHGAARTLATVPSAARPPIATVYELAATPRRVRADLFTDEGLVPDLAPAGRLGRLLRAAAQPGASWAVDPELVDEVTDMADGYRVVEGTTTKAGTGQAAAQQWLTEFKALPAEAGVQTLYARPDLAGAAEAGASDVLPRALAATKAAGLKPPVVALQQRLSAGALRGLAAAGVPAVSDAVAPGPPLVQIEGARVVPAVSLDAPVDSPVIADTAVNRAAAAAALASVAGGQVRLVDGSSALTQDARATALPSWAEPATLPAVLSRTPAATLGTDALTREPASGALTTALGRRLTTLDRNLTTYGAAAPGSKLADVAHRLAAAGASEAWLTDPAGRTAFLATVDARTRVAQVGSGVRLTATGTVTMAAANTQFPATITNTLADTIRVRVVAESQNSARLEVDPSGWVEIRPNDSQTVLLTARAAGNGVVPVTLHVEGADGVVLSLAVPVAIEATNLGAVGWVIIAVSGVVLVATTALRIRQVRRARARTLAGPA